MYVPLTSSTGNGELMSCGPLTPPTSHSRSLIFVVSPAVSGDELTLYYQSGNPLDVWQAIRSSVGAPFGMTALFSEIDSSFADQDVSITDDGLEVFWASNRTDLGGAGKNDLYHAVRPCAQ